MQQALRAQTASWPSAKWVWAAQKSRPQYWQECWGAFGQWENRPPSWQIAEGIVRPYFTSG